jgi:hypothetical protein
LAGAQYSADLVKYVLSAIDTKIQTVVKKYIDDKFKNLKITGDQIAQNSVPGVVFENGTISKQKIYEFAAEVATIAAAEIESAVIDTAQIENLSAYVADIVVASIGTAEIDWAEIANLTAVIASIAVASIGSAKIDFAQIYDLIANTALITQGVGGKFFISQLVVTEANMVSLTVGELIVKGSDGLFYKFSVDEAGLPVATLVEVAGDNIADATIAGGNLIEGTITAREINATSIFAQDATILELIANNIDTATLFANETFTGALRTNLIESDIGGFLMIEGDGGVRVSVSEAIGGLEADVSGNLEIISRHEAAIDMLADSIESKVSQTTYEADMENKADKATVSTIESTLRQDIGGWQARITRTEGDITVLKLGVDVTENGVTIQQPSQTSTKLTIAAGSLTFTVPGKDALVISADDPDASYMHSLRVDRFVRGNLVTTVSGSGENCRIVDQYIE